MIRFLCLAVCALLTVSAHATPDPTPDRDTSQAAPTHLFDSWRGPLEAAGIDVVPRHDADTEAPSFGDAPRLTPLYGFAAWPGVELDMDRHGTWLEALRDGVRGAVAAVEQPDAAGRHDSWSDFHALWSDAAPGRRVLITFDTADEAAAEAVAEVLEADGYAVYLHVADPEREPLDPASIGRLLVEADHCLTIDTASARLNAVIQYEAELLAELRRQHAWSKSEGDRLPPIRRGALDVVESMGALPMKILPGGVLLGMSPTTSDDIDLTTAERSQELYGVRDHGLPLALERVSEQTCRAIDGFIGIDSSHSVVDIAGGSIAVTEPFRQTRIGDRMIRADRRPFEYLSVRGAKKSLIVDDAIHIRRTGDRLAADVTLEVRFYEKGTDDRAERIATLRFTVEDATGSARLLDLAWQRRPGRRIGFDGANTSMLIDQLESLAGDAALIAFARATKGQTGVRTAAHGR